MVHGRLAQRLALQPRQILGDGGFLDGLFGDDDQETTTRGTVINTATRNTATETLTTIFPTGSRIPTVPTDTSTIETGTSTDISTPTITRDASSTIDTSTTLLSTTTEPAPESIATTEPPAPSDTTTETPNIHTITSIESAAVAAPTVSESAVAERTGFLDNKPLAGVVFGLVGLVGLALFIFLIILFVRRSRRKKLLEDAVSFDPSNLVTHSNDGLSGMNRPSSTEKTDLYSGSEQSHGYAHSGYQTSYDMSHGGYPNPYNFGNNYGSAYAGQYNNHPAQLPSVNVSTEGSKFQGVAPALPSPMSGSQAYGGYSTDAPVRNNSPSPRPVSDNGSIKENNPYLGTKDYKVANA